MSREMKHSGIEWIGEIPKEWKVTKFKFMSEMYTGNSLNEHQKEYYSQYHNDESTLPYISTKDVERDIERVNYDGEIRIPESEKGFSIAPPNSVLLCIEGGSAGKKVGFTNQKICFVNKLCCFNSKQNSRYLFFYILSNAFNEPFTQNIQGLIGGVSVNTLKNFYITTPSLSEQQKIANYLDKVCGEVDEMIALQEQMIEELKTYKQSVITEAVTKGLNPGVPMKDSGIDWIGEVPEGWLITKAKFFVTIGNGSDPKTEGDIPVYGSGSASFKTCGEYKMGPTVLIGRKGATLHIPHYIEGKYWNVDTAFDVKSKGNISLRYYYFLAICFDYKYYISQTTLPGMAQSSYNNMEIPVPPLEEQQTIASYLDTKCAEIDALIAIKQQKIDELKDYKKSVIYEYVTGKKEVV